MTQQWDEFSKSLAQSIPRRESLRRFGAILAGVVLSPLGFEAALGAGKDPCKTFCRCRNKSQQSQCLAACKACGGDISGLCGGCGSYACADFADDIEHCGACFNYCGAAGPYEAGACIDGRCEYGCVEGATRCNGTCTLLDWDQNNCGDCGNICEEPGPNEYGWCENGACEYACFEGASRCDGTCTDQNWDPDNCGACGNVCGESAPHCDQGACSECTGGLVLCGGACISVAFDTNNCGACGNVCGGATPYCAQGVCTNCEGAGGAICNGVCIDVNWDNSNCGACGNVCSPQTGCSFGVCHGACIDC